MQDNVVWTSTLDGKYEVTVTRTAITTGNSPSRKAIRFSIAKTSGYRTAPSSERTWRMSLIGSGSQSSSWMDRSLSPNLLTHKSDVASAYHITLIVKDSCSRAIWPWNPSLPHGPPTKCLELAYRAQYGSRDWQICPTTSNQF